MNELKFRIWNEWEHKYYYPLWSHYIMFEKGSGVIELYIGLEDKNGNEYHINDIGQFENGDRFIIKIEDFLQCYIEWIGNPKCEDQGRDLYRIERAERIGNIHQDKHLLK